MNITIELGQTNDIDEIEALYNDLHDHLERGVNYPGWKKGIYPIREDALDGLSNKTLFVAKHEGRIVGSLILNHVPDPAYHNAKWSFDLDYLDVIVIHTFVVHPSFMTHNIGKRLLDFADKYGIESNIRSIRLDVYEGNIPAIRLYEKCGYKFIDTVDLGLGEYGLKWFKLYEKVID